MKCRLFKLIAAISLLLLVAVAALWMRAYFITEKWSLGSFGMTSTRGELSIFYWEFNDEVLCGKKPLFSYGHIPASVILPDCGPYGFKFSHEKNRPDQPNAYCARSPCWFLCLFFLLPPLLKGLAIWTRKPPKGKCHPCGYDLRATPNRCPECGKIPTKKGHRFDA